MGRHLSCGGLLCAAVVLPLGCGAGTPAILTLHITDAATGRAAPARVEVLSENGEAYVAEDALQLTFQCATAPPPDWLSGWVESDRMANPHSGTDQFYANGVAHLELPAGRYRVRVERGPEYRRIETHVDVSAGGNPSLDLALERWIDPRTSGWHGTDDHLHITRRTSEDDRRIARWMGAEGLAVANLLQMGTVQQHDVTPQHDFGDAGAFLDADAEVLVLAGQEHPRTHFLGHTITLGADQRLDRREDYIVYGRLWQDVQRHGGAAGYAHYGAGPAHDGLAIDAHTGLISFVEVLQFEYADYDVWYELLNLGLSIAPSAGTDFPCGPWSIPGRERVYVHVDGALDRQSFVAGLKSGRTFVSNGPILELDVGGAGIGETLRLESPQDVTVKAAVHFDPERDSITRVEFVYDGEVFPLPTEPDGEGRLRGETTVKALDGSWIALRVYGEKQGEAPLRPMPIPGFLVDLGAKVANGADIRARERYVSEHDVRPTIAHTAAIRIAIDGTHSTRTRTRLAAAETVERLEALKARLSDERIGEIPIWDWLTPYSDGVSEEHLRTHRRELLAAIARAQAWARPLAIGRRPREN